MKLIKTGVTRWVLLIGRYAIKFPAPIGYRNFLQGLLANQQETKWYRELGHLGRLCPVLFSSWLYLFIVMPKVAVLRDDEAKTWFRPGDFDRLTLIEGRGSEDRYPVEMKADSFGWLRQQIDDKLNFVDTLVIIDYGS